MLKDSSILSLWSQRTCVLSLCEWQNGKVSVDFEFLLVKVIYYYLHFDILRYLIVSKIFIFRTKMESKISTSCM
jgi:hypothetical protein